MYTHSFHDIFVIYKISYETAIPVHIKLLLHVHSSIDFQIIKNV